MKVIQSSVWLSCLCRWLLRQQKVVLCCFVIIAELTYSLTYQIIISLIPSIPDFFYIHFAQKNYLNTPIPHVLHSICKACDNLRMRGRRSKSARNILNDVRTYNAWQPSFTLTFASNLDCRMVFKNKFSRLLKTEN